MNYQSRLSLPITTVFQMPLSATTEIASRRDSGIVTVQPSEQEDPREANATQTLEPTVLPKIVRCLAAALQPEQILLFGSYAYNEPNEDSDIDLLVIVSHSDEPGYRRAREAYRALRGVLVPVDVIVMTSEEVQRKRNVCSSLVS